MDDFPRHHYALFSSDQLGCPSPDSYYNPLRHPIGNQVTSAKIEKKITSYKVVTQPETPVETFVKEHMHEGVGRPEKLVGATYKIKTSDHALYITINDLILNEGTEHEERRPYEIFINSKNMENFQWVLALTRLISAVFRKGGQVDFLCEELKAVFDPKGGYFKKGRLVPSLVAEIGYVIEQHLINIGVIVKEVDAHQLAYIESKKAELAQDAGEFPEQAILCTKCNHKSLVLMDGCMTCLNCGDSKCG